MILQRIDRITEPPVPGRFYLVPCVHYPYMSDHPRWWPVIGPRHEDKEFFNFEQPHYHVDGRFLNKALRDLVACTYFAGLVASRTVDDVVAVTPLSQRRNMPIDTLANQRVELRRRKCWKSTMIYPHCGLKVIQEVQRHFGGQQCKRGKGGWVCPHRKAPLGSILPDRDGVITCPLHGLRIDAATGEALP